MTNETRVLYNADCPVCNFEISHYARYSALRDLTIRFDDLNSEAMAQWNVDQDAAARRLHVLKDGEMYVGLPAFVVLWREMPRYRWLAQLVSIPGIHRFSCWTYEFLLAPVIYRAHLRRQARAQST